MHYTTYTQVAMPTSVGSDWVHTARLQHIGKPRRPMQGCELRTPFSRQGRPM